MPGAALFVFLREYLALRRVDLHLLIFGVLFIALVLLFLAGLIEAVTRPAGPPAASPDRALGRDVLDEAGPA